MASALSGILVRLLQAGCVEQCRQVGCCFDARVRPVPVEPVLHHGADDSSHVVGFAPAVPVIARSRGSSFDQVKALFPSGPNSQTGDTYRRDFAIFGDPVTLWVEFNNADWAVHRAQEGMCY